MGLVKRKIVFFYDFLPGSMTFVLWRTAKTWMQPSTKTKDTFEPSNETVFDEKTAMGENKCTNGVQSGRKGVLLYNLSGASRQLPW